MELGAPGFLASVVISLSILHLPLPHPVCLPTPSLFWKSFCCSHWWPLFHWCNEHFQSSSFLIFHQHGAMAHSLRFKTPFCMLSHFSCVWLFETLWNVACQVPQSMEFSRQECWSGSHSLLQGIFPTQGSNLCLLWFLHCRQILYRWATWETPKHPSPLPFRTVFSWFSS